MRFRVWDTVKKAMSEVQAIVYTEEKVYPIYFKEIRRYIPFSEAILMQPTGLFDKNGKEIFEGDIVKVTDDDERTDFSDGGNGTICGLDDLYMWYIDGQVQNGLFDINQEYYIEVIGNIYENPELLEEAEDDTKV